MKFKKYGFTFYDTEVDVKREVFVLHGWPGPNGGQKITFEAIKTLYDFVIQHENEINKILNK